jgi:hypothetical protein
VTDDVETGQIFDGPRRNLVEEVFAITVNGYYTKRGWVERVLQRLKEQIILFRDQAEP